MDSVSVIMERDAIAIPMSASVTEALEMMRQGRIGIAPVVEAGRLVGLITKEMVTDPGHSESKVVDVMVGPGVFVEEGMEVEQSAHLMVMSHMARLPVVNNSIEMKVVGVVTSTGIVRELKK